MTTMITSSFSFKEFYCKCGCGLRFTKIGFVERLQVARNFYGRSMNINSGYRCPKHNKEVGGKEDSRHPFGDAADIECEPWEFGSLLFCLIQAGFRRFGLAASRTLIHVDEGPIFNGDMDVWIYGDK